jgi:arginyl-tRNA synthetase
MIQLKAIFTEALMGLFEGRLTAAELDGLIEVPKHTAHGDLAFPCYTLSKKIRQAPAIIAAEAAGKLQHSLIDRAEAHGPYLNVFFSREKVGLKILQFLLEAGSLYGNSTIGSGKTITIDFSAPNIAKPFSMGHLRSTVIGNSISQIAEKCGYEVIRINHLGDWGTQFGKLITAYKKWGSPSLVKEKPIAELFKLYIRFHEEAEKNPGLEDEGRRWFRELEQGNEEAHSLWSWFREEPLKEFNRIYDLLGITFDSYNGEAFYNDRMEKAVGLLKSKNLLTKSEGAEVVSLEEEGLPPCLIKKSDGATLYATRDLAAAIFRQETYHFSESLYVVGQEQSIHFRQLKLVLKKLGFEWADEMHHIPFGLYLKDGKKMSTRKGRVVLLEDVLNEAVDLAYQNICRKNPSLEQKEEIAAAVGIGSVLFHDLKNDRLNHIEFSLEEMLTFEGETGPYIQYTNARAHSILQKAGTAGKMEQGLSDPYSWDLLKLLSLFPGKIEEAHKLYSPSVIAKYIISVAQSFNKYYGQIRILEDTPGLETRLSLVRAAAFVLEEGLRLLGIAAPEKM